MEESTIDKGWAAAYKDMKKDGKVMYIPLVLIPPNYFTIFSDNLVLDSGLSGQGIAKAINNQRSKAPINNKKVRGVKGAVLALMEEENVCEPYSTGHYAVLIFFWFTIFKHYDDAIEVSQDVGIPIGEVRKILYHWNRGGMYDKGIFRTCFKGKFDIEDMMNLGLLAATATGEVVVCKESITIDPSEIYYQIPKD